LLGYAYLFGLLRVLASLDYPMLLLASAGSVAVGVMLAIVAGIYPARVAAKMIPAAALASHV
jgi:ABC-type lipoprotein release transport system permease subunit